MSEEPWYQKVDREAAERLSAMLALRMPDFPEEAGSEDVFDPWDIFPALYGSYSSGFDELALQVLGELRDGVFVRDDLAAEMFREMLCTAHLCDYGSSPRVCFPTWQFKNLLPDLIEKWRAYAALQWGPDWLPSPPPTIDRRTE